MCARLCAASRVGVPVVVIVLILDVRLFQWSRWWRHHRVEKMEKDRAIRRAIAVKHDGWDILDGLQLA